MGTIDDVSSANQIGVHVAKLTNAEGRKPAQLYDLAHPRGAYSFHELLSDQELEYAVDYQGTLVLQRPECVIDGNASAHMLNVSTYSNLRNAYETILAKTMYRSISKNSGVLAQLLVRSTFPGAGRWSGYWNPERNPYKRSVQDMLLHNIMGMPALRDGRLQPARCGRCRGAPRLQ
ncbi:uncharacterized protein LOC119398987 [Rhipicephalus sanguineus]|uniref:uncharacterized protein LOC119398987 n=1 Tax=Rhipicephalus sanguineus TaxID=34632 RepID=UPI0020C312DE|nr:uncharacterized protein LOC119398987 [Rhipicephalus sanguineus]